MRKNNLSIVHRNPDGTFGLFTESFSLANFFYLSEQAATNAIAPWVGKFAELSFSAATKAVQAQGEVEARDSFNSLYNRWSSSQLFPDEQLRAFAPSVFADSVSVFEPLMRMARKAEGEMKPNQVVSPNEWHSELQKTEDFVKRGMLVLSVMCIYCDSKAVISIDSLRGDHILSGWIKGISQIAEGHANAAVQMRRTRDGRQESDLALDLVLQRDSPDEAIEFARFLGDMRTTTELFEHLFENVQPEIIGGYGGVQYQTLHSPQRRRHERYEIERAIMLTAFAKLVRQLALLVEDIDEGKFQSRDELCSHLANFSVIAGKADWPPEQR